MAFAVLEQVSISTALACSFAIAQSASYWAFDAHSFAHIVVVIAVLDAGAILENKSILAGRADAG